MTPTTEMTIDLSPLRDRFTGDLQTSTDPGWDEARSAWNLAVDQHPAVVAIPEDADDVARAVRFARDRGIRVAVQGTGHNAAAHGDLAGVLLIKTERLRDVRVEPATRTARVGAGVTWGEVVGPAAEHGLAALAGSSHDVGIVGYSLGGGVSWLARKHGLAAERITAIEFVSAHGDLREVTALTDPDLFWAIRGGGGNFGVVTAMEFELLPITEVYAGALFFPYERAAEVLEAWRQWTRSVPDEVTSVGRMIQIPPIPDVPEFLRGRSFTVIEATFLGTEQQGAELLAPLRELGPEMDTFAIVTPPDLLALHMDPPGPVPGQGDHQMLADLDAESLQRLVAAVGPGTDSPLLSFEFRHLGGALGRRGEGSGALGALGGRYMTFAVGMLMDPAMAPPLQTAFAAAREALDVVDSGAAYLNFAESRVEPGAIFGERTLGRLREIRANVDPEGMFLANHSIDA
ncbi:MAG TPA: FAD-binding oxidoreductase [Solirubrobacterales bacterium]|jgi:UDP-N-acetylenolpyruvoylglucosamine reductase|nr:FAD-binding oxidoreductase [Solirubrobacterales bacterium]